MGVASPDEGISRVGPTRDFGVQQRGRDGDRTQGREKPPRTPDIGTSSIARIQADWRGRDRPTQSARPDRDRLLAVRVPLSPRRSAGVGCLRSLPPNRLGTSRRSLLHLLQESPGARAHAPIVLRLLVAALALVFLVALGGLVTARLRPALFTSLRNTIALAASSSVMVAAQAVSIQINAGSKSIGLINAPIVGYSYTFVPDP